MRSSVRTIACIACLATACTLQGTGANGPHEGGGRPSAGSGGVSSAGAGGAQAGRESGGAGGSAAGSPAQAGSGTSGEPVTGGAGTGGIKPTGGTGDVGGAGETGGTGAAPGGGTGAGETGGSESGGGGSGVGGGGGTGGGETGGTGATGGSPAKCGNGQLEAGEACDPGLVAVFGCTAECRLDGAAFGVVLTDPSGRAHGYWLGAVADDWLSARAACQLKDGDLATIGSANEQEALLSLVRAEETWVGAEEQNASIVNPAPRWIDGTPWNPAFAVRYVSNTDTELCIILQTTGYWRDRVCEDPYPFLCEWVAPGA